MAQLIHSPTGSGPQGEFERTLVQTFVRDLPANYKVLPNFSLRERGQNALEYDIVIFAPHAIYVVEAKEWYGRISGDDTEWLLNSNAKKCPLWLVRTKCQVLKSRLGALASRAWVAELFVVPNGTQIMIGGSWVEHTHTVASAVPWLQDPSRIRFPSNILPSHDAMVRQLQGAWAARRRGQRRRIAGFEITETITATTTEAEYLARRALVDDPRPYRIRTWHLSGYASDAERDQRLAVIRRPTEAVARIDQHPNLLQVLEFNELPDDNEFYEVTEWSAYGTLHGYLRNSERERLTLRERMEIAAGVADALQAVHGKELIHRNLCPENILIGSDRRPRLTDFDRAYIENRQSVFAETEGRRRNPAYVPPELQDSTDYDFDTGSDMYSFGVLLYELLTGQVPFAGPEEARAAAGKPARLPSQLREGVNAELDELVLSCLNVSDVHSRPAAIQALAVLRDVLDESSEHRTSASSPTGPDDGPPKFAPGDVIDGIFRVEAVLGRGSFSQVLKVYHLDQGQSFAMKVLTKSQDADLILHEYNQVGRHLPTHPNIARMIWMSRLAPPRVTPYILSEYVEGETLDAYCDGRKTLPWSDIRRIGLDLLDALAALHAPGADIEGFLHRDIKPANIILELPSHRTKLIDFNIASRVSEAQGQGGTPRYWAPDRGRPTWHPNVDLFSLGVVLYELVTHRHPYACNSPDSGQPYDPREIAPDVHIRAELAEFLLHAVQPNGADRFQSAAEMRSALDSIPSMAAPQPPAVPPGDFGGLTLLPGVRSRVDVARCWHSGYVS